MLSFFFQIVELYTFFYKLIFQSDSTEWHLLHNFKIVKSKSKKFIKTTSSGEQIILKKCKFYKKIIIYVIKKVLILFCLLTLAHVITF